MKKEGFNPRINSDSTKNLFKMDLDDIDEQNKLLESKLKSKKTKINHIDYSIKKIDSTKISSRDKNHLQNSCNYEVSFVSNKSTISPRESKCSSKPRSPQMMTRFKNKLDTSILNTSNLEIKTSKTTKNLIPFTEEERKMKDLVNKMKICQKHNLPNEKNYFVTEKNLKLIENALSEKDTDISNLKNLVYYAKNEFDNFKLKFKELNRVIEEQAEEKAEILKAYDNMAKYNKQLKENYDDYSFQYNKMLIYFKKLESLVHLVVKLKDSYHDTEKSETIVTKIEKLESKSNKYVKKKPNMKASEETLIYIPKTKKNDPDLSKVIENIKQISQILEEDELKAYVALFISSEVKNSLDNKNFLKSSSVIDYQKLEKENKQLKDKVYDYESFVEKMSFLYESKKFDLTDMAKDMIDTKKRISQITSMNDSLEKENDYLRISYHNLYNEFVTHKTSLEEGKENFLSEIQNYVSIEASLKETNKSLCDRLTLLEKENTKLNEEIKKLQLRLEEEMSTKFNLDKLLEKSLEKEKYVFETKLNEMHVTLSNLKYENSEKDKIISELNNQILDNRNKILLNDQQEMQAYLNKSEESGLKKKNLSIELENKFLKEKLKEYELESGLANKKTSGSKVFIADLFYHIYNQAQIIESKIN